MAYATAADLTARYDSRMVADLASDSGNPVGNVSTDTNVQASLDDASGMVDSAVTVARVYLLTDLTALTGTDQSLLKRITCDLAIYYLMSRRPEKLGSSELKEQFEKADVFLEMLRKGARVFAVEGNLDAGLPTVDGPRASTYERLNLIPDRTRNFFPARGSRLPRGRQG